MCTSKFPASFKFASVTLNFKEGSRNQKNNSRPFSILPISSKIFEKLICRQLLNHFDNNLSKFQCGFRKGYSLQHCPLLMMDKWKKAVDNNIYSEPFLLIYQKHLIVYVMIYLYQN